MDLFTHSLSPASTIISMLGIFAFSLAMERLVTISKATRNAGELSRRISEMIRKGQLNLAEYTCDRFDSPVSRVMSSGIRSASRGLTEIHSTMKRVADKESASLLRGLSLLESMALIGPLIGLTGTLYAWKQISSFSMTALNLDFAGLAQQFSLALDSSIAGLIVAVISGLFSIFLHYRSNYACEILESLVTDLSPAIDRAGRGEVKRFDVHVKKPALKIESNPPVKEIDDEKKSADKLKSKNIKTTDETDNSGDAAAEANQDSSDTEEDNSKTAKYSSPDDLKESNQDNSDEDDKETDKNNSVNIVENKSDKKSENNQENSSKESENDDLKESSENNETIEDKKNGSENNAVKNKDKESAKTSSENHKEPLSKDQKSTKKKESKSSDSAGKKKSDSSRRRPRKRKTR